MKFSFSFTSSLLFSFLRFLEAAFSFFITLQIVKFSNTDFVSATVILTTVFGIIFLVVEHGRSFDLFLEPSHNTKPTVLFFDVFACFLILSSFFYFFSKEGLVYYIYFFYLFSAYFSRLLLIYFRKSSKVLNLFLMSYLLKFTSILLLLAYSEIIFCLISFVIIDLVLIFYMLTMLNNFWKVGINALSIKDVKNRFRNALNSSVSKNQLSYQFFIFVFSTFFLEQFINNVKEFRIMLAIISLYMVFHSSFSVNYSSKKFSIFSLGDNKKFFFLFYLVTICVLNSLFFYAFNELFFISSLIGSVFIVEYLYLLLVTNYSIFNKERLNWLTLSNLVSLISLLFCFFLDFYFSLLFFFLIRFLIIIFVEYEINVRLRNKT